MSNHEFPQKYFGENVQAKLGNDGPQLTALREDFAGFIKGLPHGAKVLDAGCGNGKFLKAALALRPDLVIYANDISDVSAYLPHGVEFKQASIEDLDQHYAADSFDAVICFHVIEHLITPIKMMAALKIVMKKDALLYLETPNWTRAYLPFAYMYFWNDYTHIRIFTKRTFMKLFYDFNFSAITVKSKSSDGINAPVVVSPGRFHAIRYAAKKASKLLNPLLKDVLIGIAANKK